MFLILGLYPFINFHWGSNNSRFTHTMEFWMNVNNLGSQVVVFLLEAGLALRLSFLDVSCWRLENKRNLLCWAFIPNRHLWSLSFLLFKSIDHELIWGNFTLICALTKRVPFDVSQLHLLIILLEAFSIVMASDNKLIASEKHCWHNRMQLFLLNRLNAAGARFV